MNETTMTLVHGPAAMSAVPVSTPASEATALLHMIERVARDPAVDIAKLLQLSELRERIKKDAAEEAWDAAMAAAQGEMRAVSQDSSNPSTRSRYASYHAIDRALRPIYTKHGFALSFDTGEAPDNWVRVTCRVSQGGCSRHYHIDMPADGAGAKGGQVMTRTHATGSAITYGRRYLLLMIFNVAVGGEEDDDGNAAGARASEYITQQQASELHVLLENTGGNLAKFCEFAKIDKLADLPANRYEAAVNAVRRAASQRKVKTALQEPKP